MKISRKILAKSLDFEESKNGEVFYIIKRSNGNLTIRYFKETIGKSLTIQAKIKGEDVEIVKGFIKYLKNVSDLQTTNFFSKVYSFAEYKRKFLNSQDYQRDLENLFLERNVGILANNTASYPKTVREIFEESDSNKAKELIKTLEPFEKEFHSYGENFPEGSIQKINRFARRIRKLLLENQRENQKIKKALSHLIHIHEIEDRTVDYLSVFSFGDMIQNALNELDKIVIK